MHSKFRILAAAVLAVAATGAMAESGPKEPLTRAAVLAQAGERFDKADANKDGTLSREEMKAMHESRKGDGPREGAEEGGRPPRGEDGAGPKEPLTRAQAVARATERFDQADADKDGVLSREEMKAMHESRKGDGGERPQRGERPPRGERPAQ